MASKSLLSWFLGAEWGLLGGKEEKNENLGTENKMEVSKYTESSVCIVCG